MDLVYKAVKYALGEGYNPDGSELESCLRHVQQRLDARGRKESTGKEGVYLAVTRQFVRTSRIRGQTGSVGTDSAEGEAEDGHFLPAAIVSVTLSSETAEDRKGHHDKHRHGVDDSGINKDQEKLFAAIVVDGEANGNVGTMGVMFHGEFPVMHVHRKALSPTPPTTPATVAQSGEHRGHLDAGAEQRSR